MRINLSILFFFLFYIAQSQNLADLKFLKNKIFVKIKNDSEKTFPSFSISSNGNSNLRLQSEVALIISEFNVTEIKQPFLSLLQNKSLQKIYVFTFKGSLQVDLLIKKISQLPYVEYAERVPEYHTCYTPNDVDPGQWNLTKINAVNAWSLNKGSSSKVIAIVDDEVRISHEDLNANIWINPGEVAGNGIDDDGNGYIDDINGYDVADDDNNPGPPSSATNSKFTHGTHCAGIASGVTDNNKGIASIGFSTKLMAVKCTPDNLPGGSLPNAYEGVAYAIASKANVISMSWGGGSYSITYQLLFNQAYADGIICVAAAGNSNTDIPMFPASYNHVISVAASDANDGKASFSNYGSTVDVTAPGVGILSTLAGSNSSYGNLSGTSMACPLVSGLCALMLSVDSKLTPDALLTCLKSSCDNINSLNPAYTGMLGAGRINAYKALLCLQKTPLADFTALPRTACPGQPIQFTNLSAGNLPGATYLWTFPGGTPSSSSLENPIVTYAAVGVYNVSLQMTNSFGTNTKTQSSYITITKPTGTLSGAASIPTGGSAFLKIDFTGQGPFDITYSNGSVNTSLTNIATNPFYFQVSPVANTTYSITSLKSGTCVGTYIGTATVNIGSSTSGSCTGMVTFEKTIGGSSDDDGRALFQVSDGSYYSFGETKSFGTGLYDITLSKLDNSGNHLWTKKYGGSGNERIFNATLTNDNNLILCGNTDSYGSGAYDVLVMKIDLNGTVLWTKTYGGASEDQGRDIKQTADGGYIISALTYSFGSNPANTYIIKIDASGNIEWTKVFQCEGNDFSYGLRQTSDQGYIIAGSCQVGSQSNHYDYLIIRIDKDGNLLWDKEFGTPYDEAPRDLVITPDGGFIIAGHIRIDPTQPDALILKMDQNGNKQWSKVLGGSSPDDFARIIPTSDGNYIAVGQTASFGDGLGSLFVKFDVNGNVLWSKTYGKTLNDLPNGSFGGLTETNDGGLAMSISSNSAGAGGYDYYIIKTDCNGNTGCTSKDITSQSYAHTLTLFSRTLSAYSGASVTSPAMPTTSPTPSVANVCNVSCSVKADFTANDTTICLNSAVQFTNTSVGGANYQWFVNGQLLSTAKDFNYTFNRAGKFLVALNTKDVALGCENSDTLSIIVNLLPQLSITNDTTICNATSVLLKVNGAASYSWNAIPGLSCYNCFNPIANPIVNTKYVVTGTDLNGCKAKDSVAVSFTCCYNGKPVPKADFSISDTSICFNDSISITDKSFVTPSATYKWKIDSGKPSIYNGNNPHYISFTTSGRHRIRLIVKESCATDSIDKFVDVFPMPVSNYKDTAVCGNKVQIKHDDISDYSYLWTPSVGVSDPTVGSPILTLSNNSTSRYKISVTDNATGCQTTDSIRVTSNLPEVGIISSRVTACANDTIQLSNLYQGSNLNSWFVDNIPRSNAEKYKFVSQVDGVFKIILKTTNTVKNCSNYDTLTLLVNPRPVLTLTNDTSVCINSSVPLQVKGAVSYQWDAVPGLSCYNCSNPIANPSTATKYFVTGVSVNNCKTNDSIRIGIACCKNGRPLPDPDFILVNSICINDSLEIEDNSFTTSHATYEWFIDSGKPAKYNGNNLPRIKFTSSGIHKIRLIIHDSCAVDSIDKIINVLSIPEPQYKDTSICNNKIKPLNTNTGNYSYLWSPSPDIAEPNIKSPEIKLAYNTSSMFHVKITDNSTGCFNNDSLRITSFLPTIAVASPDTLIELGNEIQLNACCGISYSWYPTDYLNNVSIKDPIAIPENSITYYVTITDLNGCLSKDSVLVKVDQTVFIPNLITPNGDKDNDVFVIKGICKNSSIAIYNRWGSLIYQNNNYSNTWDGGKTEGVYYYELKEACSGKEYNGWVQVIK